LWTSKRQTSLLPASRSPAASRPKASGQEGLSLAQGPDLARLPRSSSANNEWKDVESDNFVPIFSDRVL
jgi:hypothetical protein